MITALPSWRRFERTSSRCLRPSCRPPRTPPRPLSFPQSACDILEWAGPLIKASVEPGGAFEGYPVHCAGHSFGGAVAACLAGLLDGAIDVEAPSSSSGQTGEIDGVGGGGSDGERNKEVDGGGRKGARAAAAASAAAATNGGQKRRRGAAAGARGEAFRDRDRREKRGGRSSPAPSSGGESDESRDEDEEGEDGSGAVRVDGAAPWVAVCRDRVTCVTLGCPPCLSQNMRLPFVTSFVLGDDMVPRTTHESLRRLKRRLLQASGGRGAGGGVVCVPFFFSRSGGGGREAHARVVGNGGESTIPRRMKRGEGGRRVPVFRVCVVDGMTRLAGGWPSLSKPYSLVLLTRRVGRLVVVRHLLLPFRARLGVFVRAQ